MGERYFWEISDEDWEKNYCSHCVHRDGCDKSDDDCMRYHGFSFSEKASSRENEEYINKNIIPKITGGRVPVHLTRQPGSF